MDDRRLYETILGPAEPGYAAEVEALTEAQEIRVRVEWREGGGWCARSAAGRLRGMTAPSSCAGGIGTPVGFPPGATATGRPSGWPSCFTAAGSTWTDATPRTTVYFNRCPS